MEMMFKIREIIFGGLSFMLIWLLFACHPTSIRPEVERIILRVGRFYTPGAVGYEGRLMHQDKIIDTLASVASIDELYLLASSDRAPMTRLAAFIALMQKQPDMAKNLALMDIQDQSCVPAQYGCSVYLEPLANLRIEILQQEGRHYGLTKADSVTVDSCVLFASHVKHLDYLRQLLRRIPPHRTYYARVKFLFFNEHYIEALVALARYRKTEDVQYVLDALHGKVKDPADVDAYWEEYNRIHTPSATLWDKLLRWLHSKKAADKAYKVPERWFDMHARWEYSPADDDYNDCQRVKEYALQCIAENPNVPAYRPYLKAAKAYRDHSRLSDFDLDAY